METSSTYTIKFKGNKITLQNAKMITTSTNVESIIESIIESVRIIHKNHIQKERVKNFESDIREFLLSLIKNYLDTNFEQLIGPYYNEDRNSFTGWKNLLALTADRITFVIDTVKGKILDYNHNIKLIDLSIKTHSIIVILKNTKDNRFLQATILFEKVFDPPTETFLTERKDFIKVTVKTKIGAITFK